MNKTFDDYVMHLKDREGDLQREKFDVIQAIHSFYFVDNVEKSMHFCYESLLEEKGVMVLTAKREDYMS